LNNNINEYYKTLFDNAYEPILLLDNNGFIDGNKAAIKILNMKSKKELLKLHPSQISPKTQPDGETSLEKANEMIDICLKKGSNKFEWLHKTIDDKEFLVEVSLKKEIIDNKDIIHVVWRDISEKKKYEQYLIKQNEELAKKNQYINRAACKFHHHKLVNL
jgi:PAS domain S-box-containing protein